ncbi:hypothetical protein ACIBCR_11460 [Micromonospora echinospora]|uniref:hypothetical protein n=1 Tax=Micromonospora echinospora TaxID=1877 RepID=UPI0037B7CE4B
MAPMIVVQYADISAAGFSPQEDSSRRAPRAFWRAAEDLLLSDVVQPPESIRSTVGQPVWSLRPVTVDGVAHWCFAVQGRGGPFGVAGTCRFGFLAADAVHPADAWAQGRDELTAGDPPARAPDAGAVAAAYRTVLTAVLQGRQVVEIPLDAVDAAALIPNVLAALPPGRTRRWSWSTCLLQRPELGSKRVAAGRLPETMAANAPNLARNLERLFAVSRDADDALRFANAAQEFGFDWLVRSTTSGRRLDAELQTVEVNAPQLLERIAARHKDLTLADVPGLLADAAQRPRLLTVLDLLRRWSKSNVSQALRHVQDNPGSEVRRHVFDALVEVQDGRPDRNVLGLPTASRPYAGWHGELADLLDHHFDADRLAIADFARGLSHPGGVYADLADRRAARKLWLDLGVGHDLAPDAILFEASADFVVRELAGQRRIPDVVLDEIGWLRDRVAEVTASLDRTPRSGLRLAPGVAVDLVAAVLAPRRSDRADSEDPDPYPQEPLHRLARLLTRTGGSPEWTRHFLDALLAAQNIDLQHLQPLAYGALLGYGDLPGATNPIPRDQLRDLFLRAGLREGPEWPLCLLTAPPAARPTSERPGPSARPGEPFPPESAPRLHYPQRPGYPVSPVDHSAQTVPSRQDRHAGSGPAVPWPNDPYPYPHTYPHPGLDPAGSEPPRGWGALSSGVRSRWEQVRSRRSAGRGGPPPAPPPGDAGGHRRVSTKLILMVVVTVAAVIASLALLFGVSQRADDDPDVPSVTPPVTEVPRSREPSSPEPLVPTGEPPFDTAPPWGFQS